MDPILNRFRDKFFEETNNLLNQLENDLLELEKDPDDIELIETVFRAMHTIKGISGMYGFLFISEVTHQMESIYQAVREKQIKFNHDIFEITFQTIDHIRKLLSDEKLENADLKKQHMLLESEIAEFTNHTKVAGAQSELQFETQANVESDNFNTWHILLSINEKIFFRGVNLPALFKDLSNIGTFQIKQLEFLGNNDTDIWSVILSTKSSEFEIRDIFMFIEDNCTFTCISDKNILDREIQNNLNRLVLEHPEQSIIDYIENTKEPKSEQPKSLDKPENRLPRGGVKASIASEQSQTKRISVDAAKLDNLMYLVSELITINSQLLIKTRNKIYKDIRQEIQKVDSLSKMFRDNALEIRLIPLSDVILRFQRLIRDLSKQLGKKIDFVTQNIDTELDKNTIDQLHEPLMHLIRNCIDHGIELPEQRLKSGKPENGTIKISAHNSGSYVYIRIEDDGAGIHIEKVKQKAIDKGFLNQNDKPSRKEIFNFIFLPGFSTAQNLTDVSGRGVGMDVVRRKILDLRGDIDIESTDGVGTSFIIKLQQSIAIIDTLLFKVENQFFCIPLSEIEICKQITSDDILTRQHTGTIPYNDTLIPFIDARKLFDIQSSYPSKLRIIIVNNNNNYLALIVDKIIGEHQAVNKPLGKAFQNQKIINSACQLGDGNLVFMIDIKELFNFKSKTLHVENVVV